MTSFSYNPSQVNVFRGESSDGLSMGIGYGPVASTRLIRARVRSLVARGEWNPGKQKAAAWVRARMGTYRLTVYPDVLTAHLHAAYLAQLNRFGLPVPCAEAAWMKHMGREYSFLLTRRIPGRPLDRLRMTRLRDLKTPLARLIRRVHRAPIRPAADWRTRLLTEAPNSDGAETHQALTDMTQLLERSKPPSRFVCCHGDLDPSNIILDSSGKLWLVDWSWNAQGEPLEDYTQVYILARKLGTGPLGDLYWSVWSNYLSQEPTVNRERFLLFYLCVMGRHSNHGLSYRYLWDHYRQLKTSSLPDFRRMLTERIPCQAEPGSAAGWIS